jgi:hypothetical protein
MGPYSGDDDDPRITMSKGKHVVPNPHGGWSVRSAGSARAARNFSTQEDAIRFGVDFAKREQGELYVHGRDGTIKDRRSYGNDPHPPRDKR